MTEILIDWVADKFPASDIIDLYFVLSDLVDIPLTESELCETAFYDAFATNTPEAFVENKQGNIPTGKLVY